MTVRKRQNKKSDGYGGKREGAGGPKGEDTKMIRVPVSIVDDVKKTLREHKAKLKNDAKNGKQEH